MHLTGGELTTIITSGAATIVAVAGVVAGYRAARSANQNALNIAREERQAQQKHELTVMKKAAYAQYQSALNQLALAAQNTTFTAGAGTGISGQRVDEEVRERQKAHEAARVRAQDARAEVELLADESLAKLARDMYEVTLRRADYSKAAYDSRRYYFLQALKADLALASGSTRWPVPEDGFAGDRSPAPEQDGQYEDQPEERQP